MNLDRMRELANKKKKPEQVNEVVANKPIEQHQPQYTTVYAQPAEPVYQQAPQAPVYQQEPQAPVYQQPVYQQPQQPVYQQPVAPQYQEPVQPQYLEAETVANPYQEPVYGVNPNYNEYGRPVAPQQSQQGYGYYQEQQQYQRPQPAYVPPEPAFNKSVATYNAPMTAIVTPSKDMINKIIGLPEDLGEFEIITYNGLSVDAITVKEIRDTTGKLSEIVGTYEDTHNLSVVPLDITPILPEVVELSEHDIITLNGKRYASRNNRVCNNIKLKNYLDNIYQTLCTGVIFVDSLWITASADGTDFETLKFNKFELETICGSYRNYSPKVLTSKSGKQLLVIGDRYGLIK